MLASHIGLGREVWTRELQMANGSGTIDRDRDGDLHPGVVTGDTRMPTAEHVIALLRELPPEQQAEVLDFAEFLRQRRTGAGALRPWGLCAGDFAVPDDFDASLPESELSLFDS